MKHLFVNLEKKELCLVKFSNQKGNFSCANLWLKKNSICAVIDKRREKFKTDLTEEVRPY